MASGNIGAYSYTPPPNEQGYYESLFAAADQARSGQLNGRDAVGFLSRSKLPIDLLKNIWTIADQKPKTNYLDKTKFFVAVRLIQFYQNGQTAQSQNLESDNAILMRAPYFEGVSGVSAQPFTPGPPMAQPPPASSQPSTPARQPVAHQQPAMGVPPQLMSSKPPTPQRPAQQTALAAQDPYGMLPAEQARYEDLFPQYAADGFVYGKQAVELFSKSGLGKDVLRDIWNLVDNPVDNRLSKLEFAIAMHLIICVSKKNLPLPHLLPPSLKDLKGTPPLGPGPPAAAPALPPTAPRPASAGLPPLASSGPLPPERSGMPQGDQPQNAAMPKRMSISEAFSDMHIEQNQPISPTALDSPVLQPQPQEQPVPQLQPQLQPQPQTQTQPYPRQTVQPPPEISISDNVKQNASIVSAMPNSPALSSLPQNSTVPELPNLETRALPASPVEQQISGNSDLDNCRSVLQRLQAENVSLKAQLGQFTEEEKKVQQEIANTVSEIGSLSQELTSLRGQVVNAKATLIEATSELKAQIEKRDTLKELVSETLATKDTIESGFNNMREIVELAKTTPKPQVSLSAHEAIRSDFFVFDPSAAPSSSNSNPSVNNDGYVDVSAPSYATDTNIDEPSYHPTHHATHVESQPQQQATTAYPPNQHPIPTSLTQPTVPAVDEKSTMIKEEIKQFESNINNLEREVRSSDDLLRDLSVQLDALRVDMNEAQQDLDEKKNQLELKRKGFMRGSNKVLKREIEIAEQDMIERKHNFQEAEGSFNASQLERERLIKQAEDFRREIDVRKSILSQQQEAPVSVHEQFPNYNHNNGAFGNESNVSANVNAETITKTSKSPEPPASTSIPVAQQPMVGYGAHNTKSNKLTEQNRNAVKSNESLSTGLSLESDQTNSENRSNVMESGIPSVTETNTVTQEPDSNKLVPSSEQSQSSSMVYGEPAMVYAEPLAEKKSTVHDFFNEPINNSTSTEGATGANFRVNADEQSQQIVYESKNVSEWNPSDNANSVGIGFMTEQPHSSSPTNSLKTTGNRNQTAGGSLGNGNTMVHNESTDLLHNLYSAPASGNQSASQTASQSASQTASQTDASEYSMKGGNCPSVAPTVASDPGYRMYSQSLVQQVDFQGPTGNSVSDRRASYGDMSAKRHEQAGLGDIRESNAGISSSGNDEPGFNGLGLINDLNKPAEQSFGISKSVDAKTDVSGMNSQNSYGQAGFGISKSVDGATNYGMYNTIGASHGGISMYGSDDGDFGFGGGVPRPYENKQVDNVSSNVSISASTAKSHHSSDTASNKYENNFGGRPHENKQGDNVSSNVSIGASTYGGSVAAKSYHSSDTASNRYETNVGSAPRPYENKQGNNVSSNVSIGASTYGGSVAAKSYHSSDTASNRYETNFGGSYEGGTSGGAHNETVMNFAGNDNMLGGGIPTPRNYDTGLMSGENLAPAPNSSSVTASILGEISDSKNVGDTVTNNTTGAIQGGGSTLLNYEFGQITAEGTVPTEGFPVTKSDNAGVATLYTSNTINYNTGMPGSTNENSNDTQSRNGSSSDLIATVQSKDRTNSDDRIPSPNGSYSYDYANPFLQ